MNTKIKPPAGLLGLLVLLTLACSLQVTKPTSTPSPTHTLPLLLSPTVQPSPTLLPAATETPPQLPTATSLPPTVSPIPPTTTQPPVAATLYAVILVAENDVLNVRKQASPDSAVVGQLSAQATGITLTGKEKMVGKDRWVEINHPAGGTGWVNAYYLAEYIPSADFCADTRLNNLLSKLKTAILTRDGALLASLVSPVHGLSVRYFRYGKQANYTPEEAKWVFNSTYVMDWGTHPASGLETKGSFHEIVLPALEEVLGAENLAPLCNETGNAGAMYLQIWPYEYGELNFYNLYKPGSPGVELDWRIWLTGIEYVNGQPYLFSMIHVEWEP